MTLTGERRHRQKMAKSSEYAWERTYLAVIPNLSNQYPLAQFRSPIDMIFQGWSVSLFQAWQQWSTKLS